MRRAGNLFEKVCEPGNLRLAFYMAARGKWDRPDVQGFCRDLDRNLAVLREQMLDGDMPIGHYRYFVIHDPKTRTICAASFPERVLHHALMNLCDPVFERYQIFDSYATRRDKGTFAALERAERFTARNGWYFKLDVRKYFDSIDHAILKRMLERLFKDGRLVQTFFQIIDSYETEAGRGLPIGNLTSQYFANHYLALADHYIKEQLHARRYVRYMDDMVLWSDRQPEMRQWKIGIQSFIGDNLRLQLKPVCMNHCEQGLPFLGFRVFPHGVYLRQKSRRRYGEKIGKLWQAYQDGALDEESFGQRSAALAAHIAHARSKGFRRSVLRKRGHRPEARTA